MNKLKLAWERYLADGNAAQLLHLLQTASDAKRCIHAYPSLHRICDIIVEKHPYRVMRCVACNETLFIEPISFEVAKLDQPGVPYRLNGDRLRQWVSDETLYAPKEVVDWAKYD
ncbi:hypothetical protein [Humisphaera borealis]|uniref:Uncharacterized protein n=1 Tax=Humisphaera borealis TaxID=2807512 RepID=A0A7M2X0A8_9BACT|nr:hypothetical protein [Humisphaera borealis]QOV91196.1 hypothetical protein IPV69_07500 [Humisphaera borealis]